MASWLFIISEKCEMKILVLGNRWHGNWSSTLHDELLTLGHDSKHIDVRFIRKTPIYKMDVLRKKIFLIKLRIKLYREISKRKVDRIIVITPYSIPKEIWTYVKEKNVPLVGWWGDDPILKKVPVECTKLFDRVYLVDKTWVEKTKIINPNAFYLPHAASIKNFHPTPKRQKLYDITFVGDSFSGNSEGVKRAEILKVLYENNLSPILFGDAGWNKLLSKYPFIKEIYKGPIIRPGQLNSVYNSSKIVLNIHHSQIKSGTNQRTFEAAASKAFQLSDYRDSVVLHFGESIETYSSSEELVKKASFFLTHPRERMRRAKKSYKTILEKHSYVQRIKILLES